MGLPRRAWLLAALAIAVALAGCGGAGADLSARRDSSAASAERSRAESDSPSPTRAVKVFFVKGDQFAPRTRTVPAGEQTATVAMKALLAGPTASEQPFGNRHDASGSNEARLSPRARRNGDGRTEPQTHGLDGLRHLTAPGAGGAGRLHAHRVGPKKSLRVENSNQSDRASLLKQTRQQPMARKASWISWRRS
jgi:hypothetical protein